MFHNCIGLLLWCLNTFFIAMIQHSPLYSNGFLQRIMKDFIIKSLRPAMFNLFNHTMNINGIWAIDINSRPNLIS